MGQVIRLYDLCVEIKYLQIVQGFLTEKQKRILPKLEEIAKYDDSLQQKLVLNV